MSKEEVEEMKEEEKERERIPVERRWPGTFEKSSVTRSLAHLVRKLGQRVTTVAGSPSRESSVKSRLSAEFSMSSSKKKRTWIRRGGIIRGR